MGKNYPTFRSPELSSLVERLKGLEGKIDGEQKTLGDLRASRDATDEELRNITYEWLVHYELKVRFDGTRQVESWNTSYDIVDWKYYGGEYVETEEEAKQDIRDAKREIASLTGQEVKLRDYGGEMKGTVMDHNIHWAQITKGRFKGPDEENIVFREKIPDHQPKGFDD